MENKRLASIKEPLLSWYDVNKRDLPWRDQPGAYHVWVSEIMLQQPRVEAVQGYYKRFLEAFPTVAELAAANEELLLKMWEGLGYYNRVRNMQKAARIVVEEYGGCIPADYEQLLSLPGIGSYTAGAIASIAYQIPVPAVDGNVLRVVMRILEDDSDIARQSVKKAVEAELAAVMSKERPGAYNQALMELGATVCVPNGAPDCAGCPVSDVCLGYQHGTAINYPCKAPKKERRVEEKTVFVIVDGENTVLCKREPKGLLAGLYEIPNTEGYLAQEEALEWVKQEGFQALYIERLPDAKHIFSHVEWRMRAYRIRVYETCPGAVRQQEHQTAKSPFLVVERKRILDEIPIPSAFSYYRDYLLNE